MQVLTTYGTDTPAQLKDTATREEKLREYEKQARGDAKWEYDVLELVDEIRRLKKALDGTRDEISRLRRRWQDGVFDAVDEPPPFHACARRDAPGYAIDCCYAIEPDTPKPPGFRAGQYWAAGPGTASQVNYCPYCGAREPVQIGAGGEAPRKDR